jgi:uncharacterized protein (TIGR00730 family)
MGQVIVDRGLKLVYGGASVGLMSALANTVLSQQGEVIGVVPRMLVEKEVAHKDLAQLHIVDSMHERKALMVELANAFIALPGGFGTCDEFFEVLTWAQLGIHDKPCALLNVGGFFDQLLAFLDHMAEQRFLSKEHRAMILVEEDPSQALDHCISYHPLQSEKWLDVATT